MPVRSVKLSVVVKDSNHKVVTHSSMLGDVEICGGVSIEALLEYQAPPICNPPMQHMRQGMYGKVVRTHPAGRQQLRVRSFERDML